MSIEGPLSFLLRSGPVVVFASHLDWTPIYISGNIKDVLGYPAETFFGATEFWKTLLHPDDRERVYALLSTITEVDKIEVESRFLHADGHYLHLRSEISLARDPQGAPERVVGFFLDRTRDVHQNQELKRQKQALEDANESLEQFVYVASHDLREPLIGVAGYAALALKRYGDKIDEQGKHFLEEVVRGCKAMEHKIDDLLELSRAGRGTPNGPFPLGSAVEQARRSLVGSIEKSGATIKHDNLPLVRGDRGQVAQVFQNLFSNSIKYRSKDVTPTIEVTAEAFPDDPNWWCIAVRDNGIGFDMRHADRIFGVFQRLYTIDQYPGTGIGLAIVKKIVDKHGGKIWVSAKPGHGATFYFTLAKPE